jgi:glycerol uptake facilitator-like aquaporin
MAGNIRALIAEFLGTFAWVFFAAGVVCSDASLGGTIGPVGAALGVGLTVAAVFGIFGRAARGQFNPAFTLGLVAARRLDIVQGALCLVSQLLGASLAGLFLAKAFAHAPIIAEPPFLGAPIPSGVGYRGASLLEAVATMMLAMAVYAPGAADRSGRAASIFGAIAAGAVAAAAALVIGPLTGAALNPARAFGPALATGYWHQHYVYWAGPLAGGAAGMGLSRLLFEKSKI